jgi:two-component system nitrogen regulation response regulator GlnG/two-component system response regulator HydG
VSDDTHTSTGPAWLRGRRGATGGDGELALAIAWSHAEPERVGEVARVPTGAAWIVGRGDGERVLRFGAERPGGGERRPIGGRGISREHLSITAREGPTATVELLGKAPLVVGGARATRAPLRIGDVITIENQLVLLAIERVPGSPWAKAPAPGFRFGWPDRSGMVGESLLAWTLRDEVARLARRPGHVMITGETGVGKESIARAVHDASTRAKGPFVSRSAATLPPGLVDAELFGTARNYPNTGVPERPGLIGEADGGTLFLDEIGEMPLEVQAHLLRLLDGGEYHRLGEARTRQADVRVIAATNRDAELLKHDLLARFTSRVHVGPLRDRREDIPLIVASILREARGTDATLERLFEGDFPRIDPALIEALTRHPHPGNVRELQRLLWVAADGSPGDHVQLVPAIATALEGRTRGEGEPPGEVEVRQALDRCSGNVSRAAVELGLKNRDALYRLMKRHGIER